MASLLDPFGLVGRALDTLQVSARVGVKVVGWGAGQLAQVLAPTTQRTPLALESSRNGSSPEASAGPVDLGSKMRELQSRALAQSSKTSQSELFHRILDQLTPDEARIVGALSDGSASALMHVRAVSIAGTPGRMLLENASLIGRTANLALSQLTPVYVGHLLSLGLLQVDAEEPVLKDDYQILMAESDVLKAIKRGSRGMIPARIEKHVIRLSSLGDALWAATTESRS